MLYHIVLKNYASFVDEYGNEIGVFRFFECRNSFPPFPVGESFTILTQVAVDRNLKCKLYNPHRCVQLDSFELVIM